MGKTISNPKVVEAEIEITNEYVIIKLPVDAKPSKSGKTTVLATTGGNVATQYEYKGEIIFIGATAYCYKKPPKKTRTKKDEADE